MNGKVLRSVTSVKSPSTFRPGIRSRCASTKSSSNNEPSALKDQSHDKQLTSKVEESKKTVAEQDEELRRKLEGISGHGGEAGLELENGQPVAMKRSVRENMFRLI